MKQIEWTRPKGFDPDCKAVKSEVLDLLRILLLLGLKSPLKTEYGWAFDHITEWDRL